MTATVHHLDTPLTRWEALKEAVLKAREDRSQENLEAVDDAVVAFVAKAEESRRRQG